MILRVSCKFGTVEAVELQTVKLPTSSVDTEPSSDEEAEN